jgi:PPOX class probable F420-dependent enzyme
MLPNERSITPSCWKTRRERAKEKSMTINEQQRQFLADHRLCVVGYNLAEGPPAMTPVYYVLDGDEIVISTTSSRAKAKAAGRGREMSVCVLAEESPFDYVTVFGKARIEEQGAVETMMAIGSKMTGRTIGEESRPGLEQRAAAEGRVVLRITPTRAISR